MVAADAPPDSPSQPSPPNATSSDSECHLSRRRVLRATALLGVASVGASTGRGQSNGEAIFAVSELTPRELRANPREQIEVSATVENVGDAAGEQSVEFRIDDQRVRAKEIALDSGEKASVSFEIAGPVSTGTYEYGVYTNIHSRTGNLSVVYKEPDALLVVAEHDLRGRTVKQGAQISVTATISNPLAEETTEEVRYLFGGETIGSRNVTLDAGEQTTVEFIIADTSGYEGEYNHEILTESDSASATLTVADSAENTAENDTEQSNSDGAGPGFGIAGAATALAGGSYLLGRRSE
jgi:hypothetical protein